VAFARRRQAALGVRRLLLVRLALGLLLLGRSSVLLFQDVFHRLDIFGVELGVALFVLEELLDQLPRGRIQGVGIALLEEILVFQEFLIFLRVFADLAQELLEV